SRPTRDPVSGRRASVWRRWIVRTPCRGRRSRRGKTEILGQWSRAGTRVVSSCALALRKVCRAGFAGRGTAWALGTGSHARRPSRPEPGSRVALLVQRGQRPPDARQALLEQRARRGIREADVRRCAEALAGHARDPRRSEERRVGKEG